MTSTALQCDSELVCASIAGNRDAFGHIVSRYQSLICSLAYSATGNLGQSEDLAQDTFVTAWKQLRDLREPEKLRSWLCGIARNLINNALRKQGREPSHRAEPLEEISEGPSPEPLPIETTISKEEAAILWRSLERIPEIYREPLILFYREHQSVEAVATNLDLTEDTVKQRLSRGRKLLQEQFLAFVEGALAQTNPGSHFTCSVLAALPALTLSAKAAALGSAVAKGGAAAKSAGLLGIIGTVVAPLLAIFGNYASYRMSIDEAQSDRERRNIRKLFVSSILIAAVLSTVLSLPLYWVLQDIAHHSFAVFAAILASQFVVIYFLTLFVCILITLPRRRRYLATLLSEKYQDQFPKAAFEYRSRATLFGWPLLHVRIGDRFDVIRGPVKAWIAVGSSHAIGLIFASGGIALAPISFGGVSIGLVSFGALALGALSIGAGSVGLFAYGGIALGWEMFGGCGLAWHSAMGGIVAARDFAIGGIAHAAQANNENSSRFFERDLFLRTAKTVADHGFLLMLLWVIPVALQSRIIAKSRQRRELANS